MEKRIKKKDILIIFFITILIITFIFIIRGFKKTLITKEEPIEEPIIQQSLPPAEEIKKPREIKYQRKKEVRNFEDITLQELEKKRGLKKNDEEFDLTPSIDDLIILKKKGVTPY